MTLLPANSVEGKARPFLERIENILTDLDSLRGKYMSECKVRREEIKLIYEDADNHDVPAKPLRALIKYRELERKQTGIAEGLNRDDAEVYEQLRDTLGELGAAAAERAGHGKSMEGDITNVTKLGRGKQAS